MKRIGISFCLLFCVLWSAAFIFTPPVSTVIKVAGGCSQATSFLARITTDGTHSTAYTNFICGGVTDGWWAKTDALWIAATDNTTNAALNLVSSSFSLVSHGTASTFTANTGWAGNGTNSYFDTQLNPATAGGNYVLNSATHAICVQTTPSNATYLEGNYDGSNEIGLNYTSGVWTSYTNSIGGPVQVTSASLNTWMGVRTGLNTSILYNNGVSGGTSSQISSAIPSFNIYIEAINSSGAAGIFSAVQWSAFLLGGAFNATDASNFHTRLAAYMTAVGGSGC
jgi:hypothetical protein